MTPRKLPELPFDLADVLQRFPGKSEVVIALLASNDTFRSLCEDYAVARDALHRLEAGEASRIADYRNLVRELEHDIAKALDTAQH